MTLHIELGSGDKLVSDIYQDDGDWAGISISDSAKPLEVGEFADLDFNRVSELKPHVTIVTSNPKSLDVIIAACERAKEKLALQL